MAWTQYMNFIVEKLNTLVAGEFTLSYYYTTIRAK